MELWATRSEAGASLFSVGAASGLHGAPTLEWGISAARLHDEESTLSTGLKWHWHVSSMVAIGLAGAASFTSLDEAGAELRLVVPVTWQVSPSLRLNLNSGVAHSTAGPRSLDNYVGLQAEFAATGTLDVMVEVFDRTQTEPGAQVGLPWKPGDAGSAYDLLLGHRTDGESKWSITMGATVTF